jgi:hypothetical protein
VTIDEEKTEIRKGKVSDSDKSWLQDISYSLDMRHGQIIVHHVWTLNTIATPQSPGYQVIHSPKGDRLRSRHAGTAR